MEHETIYCIDEGQGYTHKCVDHHSGECGRRYLCRYQMSETLKRHFADKWLELESKVEQLIKEDIAETLGLRSSEVNPA